MPLKDWGMAISRFIIGFSDRCRTVTFEKRHLHTILNRLLYFRFCYQRISNLLEIITVVIFSEAAHHLTMSYQQYFVKDIYNVKTHQKRYSTLNMADVLWYPCSPS